MKKKFTISILSLIGTIILTSATVILQDKGIAGYTGSPGETTCTNCHNSFQLNTGGGSITISTTPSLTSNQFVPSTTYTVMVTVAKTSHSLFGLGVEILNSSNTNAGTLAIINSASTQLKSSGVKTNVVHQLNGGAATGSKTFSFRWTAPASGNATIYASGVAANSDGGTSSDYVYNTSLPLSISTGIKEVSLDNSISIYPNPASEFIAVNYTLSHKAKVSVNLSNITGTTIINLLTAEQNVGEQKEYLSIPPSVAKGIYVVTLTINGVESSKKILID